MVGRFGFIWENPLISAGIITLDLLTMMISKVVTPLLRLGLLSNWQYRGILMVNLDGLLSFPRVCTSIKSRYA